MNKSYNIGFMMINEHSSFNAAFGLARVLKERGHKVIFFVKAGTVFPKYVEENGFKSAIIETNFFNITFYPQNKCRFRPWKKLKNHTRRVRLEQNCLSDLIEKKSLDLFFLDNIYSYPFAIVPARMRVPTILFFPNFGSKLDSSYPPVFSSLVPPEGEVLKTRYRFIYSCLWTWSIITKGRAHSLDFHEFLGLALRRIFLQLYQVGFERKLHKLSWKSTWSEWTRRPIIPEIVMAHQMLDWHSVASNPDRFYFGTTDHFRKNSDFDWSKITFKRPIVYCNISTARGLQQIGISEPDGQSVRLDLSKKKNILAKRFLEVIIDTFSVRQDWQLILACGPFLRSLQSENLPENLHLYERVPQLTILSRANLVITWGGAGTVRECVNFGVPMLLFPAWSDQFGNAARISYRNLGIHGNLLDVTPKKMIKMVERILNDKKIHFSLEEMRKQCDAMKEIQELVHFIRRNTSLEL